MRAFCWALVFYVMAQRSTVAAFTASTPAPVSASRTKSIGIPIGAVQMPCQHIHSFRLLLQDVLQTPKLKFRGIEKQGDDMALIHLPPNVADFLENVQGDERIHSFLQENSGEYLPGVRRPCPARDMLTVSPITTQNSAFTFCEFFAGIGGFRLGLESIGGQCVVANELQEGAASMYQQHFSGEHRLAVGDILDIDTSNLPDFDCLVGGFPCQPFTARGHQPGLQDDNDRGQLYREVARILQDKQPKCFLLENVPGLVTLDGGSRTVLEKGSRPTFQAGQVFERILGVFESCGYTVDWKVLNSRKWLPQMRERVYIVGIRTDLQPSRQFSWDNLVLDNLQDESPTTIRDILEPNDSPSVKVSELTNAQVASLGGDYRLLDLDAKAPTLISSYHSVHGESTRFIVTKNGKPRFLTPRECTRLMGFPEDFHVPTDHDAVSPYYQAIGNAVCPIVIATIGEELMRCIGMEAKQPDL